MGKKSTGRKRGMQRGVGKHKIRSKALKARTGGDGFLGVGRSVYFALGLKCFDLLYRGSEFFHLVPFRRTLTGEYVPLDSKEKIRYYAALSVGSALMLQKFWGTAELLLFQELRIETFMCISLFFIYLVSFMIGLGIWARPQETMDMLNSWPKILACLEDIREGPQPTPFEDMSTTLKVIAVFLVTQGIAFAAGLLSLIMSNLPICFFPMADRYGLIPQGIMPRFGWQLVFFPLEYFSYIPPMFIAPFSGGILLTLIGVLKIYVEEVRRIPNVDMERRALVEQRYSYVLHHNRVVQTWVKFMLPPTISSVSVAVIITTFVSIRYTELPLIFYVFYPYTAFTLMFVIFWMCYDTVLVVRASEDVMGQLLSHDAKYLRSMSRAERNKVLKRAKAMKVLEFPIGEFSEFSLTLPVNIWDEIINQVLFLLSF